VSNSLLIHGNWQQKMSHSDLAAISFHVCIYCNAVSWPKCKNVNYHGFNGVHCDCVALISIILNILCAEYVYILRSLQIAFVYTVLTI
jgi:hypothetical protein